MNIVKCKIADFDVAFEVDFKSFEFSTKDYHNNFEKPDFEINITKQDVVWEEENYREESNQIYTNTFKKTSLFRNFAEKVTIHNAFVLHSACFDVEGTGVAFAAHSGTGKTTHMNLWQEYLGDKMKVVNGDKPIVRFFDDEPETPYAYGTPWNGKEHLGCNMRTKLKHICFIERSETNFVEKVEKAQVIDRIFNQVYMPKDPVAVMKTMELIDRLLSCCDLWIIHCNMEKEAAKVAYETIFRP